MNGHGRRIDWDAYYDPPEGNERCELCGRHYDDCACPECPVCGVTGDRTCFGGHMEVTPETAAYLDECQKRLEGEIAAEMEFERHMAEMEAAFDRLTETYRHAGPFPDYCLVGDPAENDRARRADLADGPIGDEY